MPPKKHENLKDEKMTEPGICFCIRAALRRQVIYIWSGAKRRKGSGRKTCIGPRAAFLPESSLALRKETHRLALSCSGVRLGKKAPQSVNQSVSAATSTHDSSLGW
jgi:hypothetical protein